MVSVAGLKRAAPYAVILVAAAYLYRAALAFDYERVPGRIGPDAWPRMLLVLLMGICLIAIGQLAFGREAVPDEEASEDAQAREGEEVEPQSEGLRLSIDSHPRLALAGILLTFAYLYAFEWVGFFSASVVYLFLLMLTGGFRRPLAALAISAATALGFVFVFMKVVYVSLPLGHGPFLELSVAVMKLVGIH